MKINYQHIANILNLGHCNEKSFMYMEYHQFIVDNKLDGTIKNLKDLRSRWEEKNDEKLKELEELEDNSPNSVKKRELANEDENKFLEYTDGKMNLSVSLAISGFILYLAKHLLLPCVKQRTPMFHKARLSTKFMVT